MRFFAVLRDCLKLRKALARRRASGPKRFITLSCITLDEEDLRRLAAKKLGLPLDAPLEEILEKGKRLFTPLVEPN